jgi:MacB-like periplasmic core domain
LGWTPSVKRNVDLDGELFPTGVRGVTGNYYGTLGAAPLVGRLIAPEDAANSPGTPVAVISYEFWNRRFGRNPAVIGIRIAVGAQPETILGLILRDSVLLSAVGILVGVPCAIAAKQLIAHMLFGVASTDPLTFSW